MTTSWRLAHRMIWSATGTLLVFCFWHTLLFALVALVPVGAVALQPRAIGVAGLDARSTLGLDRPDASRYAGRVARDPVPRPASTPSHDARARG